MPTRGDLILIGISAVCIIVAAFSSVGAIDAIVGLPLTTYLPGAALVSTIAPQRRHVGAVERQIWIVGASFGLAVFGGLVLNIVGGLTRSSWLVWIGVIIIACTALKMFVPRGTIALDVDPTSTSASSRGTSDTYEVSNVGTVTTRKVPRLNWVSTRQAVLLLGAVGICLAAMVLSIHTNATTTKESFVQAWVLPRPTDDVASTSVQVGLQNRSGGQRTYLVNVTVGTSPTKVFSVLLADGASWTQVITRRPGERVESTVYGLVKPWGEIVLAKVNLATPVA